MDPFQNYNNAIEAFKKLDSLSASAVILQLLKDNKISFIKISELYTKILEEDAKENQASIATLGLMLASYCITDTSPGGKNSREHLYKSGAFGHGCGSPFGKQLDEEFGDVEK